jgi:hypothetical protein
VRGNTLKLNVTAVSPSLLTLVVDWLAERGQQREGAPEGSAAAAAMPAVLLHIDWTATSRREELLLLLARLATALPVALYRGEVVSLHDVAVQRLADVALLPLQRALVAGMCPACINALTHTKDSPLFTPASVLEQGCWISRHLFHSRMSRPWCRTHWCRRERGLGRQNSCAFSCASPSGVTGILKR